MLPDAYAYNVAFSARLRPRLDLDAFRRAVDHLVARHPALRTVFPEEGGQPVQRVLAANEAPLRVVEMPDASDEVVHAAVVADYQRPFDLDASTSAITLYRRREEDVLLVNVHHLVFDAWSLQVLFVELRTLYEAELRRMPAVLPPPAAQYRDFVASQAQMLDGKRGSELWSYWSGVLAGPLPALEVTSAAPRPATLAMRGASLPFSLGPELSAALHALARREQTTLYTVLLAAMQLLLHRFSGQSDVIVGTPVSLRSRSEFAGVIGYFVNMLPIRARISPSESFLDRVARARDAVLGALEHQDFPFPLMVSRLQVRREPNRNPIFQAMLNVQSSPRTSELARLFDQANGGAVPFGTSALMPYLIPQQEGQFELVIEVIDADGLLHGNLKYHSQLFDADAAGQLRDAFVALLGAVVGEPGASVADLIAGKREEFEL